MLRTVAALYIDPRGPYPKMEGVECWDESRDARLYDGPHPVVAHPACGPWGCLKHLYLGGEGGPELAPRAILQVRRWGGVLEHPAHSKLWAEAPGIYPPDDYRSRRYPLPRPGCGPDVFGGYTIAVNQSDWGHVARKPTWVYMVGICPEDVTPAPYPGREPTHWIGGGHDFPGRKSKSAPIPEGIKACSAQQRRRTPPLFAEWLVSLARASNVASDPVLNPINADADVTDVLPELAKVVL